MEGAEKRCRGHRLGRLLKMEEDGLIGENGCDLKSEGELRSEEWSEREKDKMKER